ncbi:MAG TPA: VanZ family protein [Gaiellaceae bacterium]|nr:VanZ family protein [Gaiellaceae bacterium]
MQTAVRRWGPAVAWAAVIFAFSSIPSLGTGLGTWDLVLRKIAHAAEFAILAILLVRAFGDPWRAGVVAVLYAVVDEIHQSFVPGRQGAVADVLIDSVGVLAGVLLAVWWRR